MTSRPLLLAILLSLAFSISAFANEPAYHVLAQDKLLSAHAQVSAGVSRLTSETRPEETKELRKQIAELRDYLDVFIYAFPSPTAKGSSSLKLRELLDEGYASLGAFKDLYDIAIAEGAAPDAIRYDREELTESLKSVLKWKRRFIDQTALDEIRKFLQSPSDQIADHSRKGLSRFFWGAVDFTPSRKQSGIENVRDLALALIDQAIDAEKETLKLEKLHKTKNSRPFHEFRKRTRSVARILTEFPELGLSMSKDTTALIALMDRYGEINDRILAFHKAQNLGKSKRAGRLIDDINIRWEELKISALEDGAAPILKRLRQALTDPEYKPGHALGCSSLF